MNHDSIEAIYGRTTRPDYARGMKIVNSLIQSRHTVLIIDKEITGAMREVPIDTYQAAAALQPGPEWGKDPETQAYLDPAKWEHEPPECYNCGLGSSVSPLALRKDKRGNDELFHAGCYAFYVNYDSRD